jgi:4-phosphopantoate--beta-alanine ligase
MSELVKEGIVAPTGLIAHGRGEAFDYLLGERTIPAAERAEKVVAAYLLEAKRPVITVNGNAAGLVAKDLIALSELIPAKLEVNLFHRSEERVEKVCRFLEEAGAKEVLGRRPDAKLEGIASERANCTKQGILAADVVFVPLEDGDRAKALVKAGKKIMAIDLNPLSRTSEAATVTVVDEITRAMPNIIKAVESLREAGGGRKLIESFDNRTNLQEVKRTMCQLLGD